MNPHVIAKSAKNLLSALEIKLNRSIGREFVPAQSDLLCIETSSYCNLKCRFCGYVKKHSPKVSMKDAMFEDCVTQAVGLGFRNFDLTPCTGDVFMDRHIANKFQFLENSPGVEGFHFFTNFSIPSPAQIERLIEFSKLKQITISIYGHDLESFIAITQSTAKVYARLMRNLEALYGLLDRKKFHLEFGFRTARDVPRRPVSDLMRLLDRFKQRGIVVRGSHVYNNWGGLVTQDDVKGLAIDITGTEKTYKNGACVYLFTMVQVMATGVVNGCACRDVDATLKIGDVRERPLREILATSNPAYMQLIEEQQRGAFRPVCRSCDFYKSIYHKRSRYRREDTALQSIRQFKDRLDAVGQFVDDSAPAHPASPSAGGQTTTKALQPTPVAD